MAFEVYHSSPLAYVRFWFKHTVETFLPLQSKIPWKEAEPAFVHLFLPDLEIICDLKGEGGKKERKRKEKKKEKRRKLLLDQQCLGGMICVRARNPPHSLQYCSRHTNTCASQGGEIYTKSPMSNLEMIEFWAAWSYFPDAAGNMTFRICHKMPRVAAAPSACRWWEPCVSWDGAHLECGLC